MDDVAQVPRTFSPRSSSETPGLEAPPRPQGSRVPCGPSSDFLPSVAQLGVSQKSIEKPASPFCRQGSCQLHPGRAQALVRISGHNTKIYEDGTGCRWTCVYFCEVSCACTACAAQATVCCAELSLHLPWRPACGKESWPECNRGGWQTEHVAIRSSRE